MKASVRIILSFDGCGNTMITIHIYYKGVNGSARQFTEEMEERGIVAAIRAEAGNLRYEYYCPLNDLETVLLIDAWEDQAALDRHHASPMMKTIAALREKYDLHMTVERFVSNDIEHPGDNSFIRQESQVLLFCFSPWLPHAVKKLFI